MLKKILIGLVVLVGGFFAVAALQPNTWTVTRKVQIDAPPAVVFAQLNGMKKFDAWNPWNQLDPAMKKTFEKEEGVGSSYSWEGNDEVGKGTMAITAVEPEKKVDWTLEFKEPFPSKANGTWALEGAAPPVTVAWTVSGHHNLMSKAMGLFVSMDKMMGPDFERGLGNLKATAEKAAKEVPAAPPPVAAPPAEAAPAAEDAGTAAPAPQ